MLGVRIEVQGRVKLVLVVEIHVVDLDIGATPLDFAYHVHTEVGHRCRGAKVNGRIVSLKHPLSTGDQVEILTGKEDSPSRDWLNQNLNFVKTSRARAKIHQWFKLQDRERNIEDGRLLIEKELAKLRLTPPSWEEVARFMKLTSADELFVGLGSSNVKIGQVLNVIQNLAGKDKEAGFEMEGSKTRTNPVVRSSQGLVVEGVSNLMMHLAGCCQPVPGDDIVGYVSLGRGVSIHRAKCSELALLKSQHPDRILAAEWQSQPDVRYPVKIDLSATDRSGLLRDVSTVLANMNVNVLNIKTESNQKSQTVLMRLTVEISSLSQLGSLFTRLGQLAGVFEVTRQV